MGLSTVSSADLNNSDYLKSRISEDSTGELTIHWDRSTYFYFPARKEKCYKIYISPALTAEEYWGNKKVSYRYATTVDAEDAVDEDDDISEGYECTFDGLQKDKYYRFKIEACYGKSVLCTNYCSNVGAPAEDPAYDDFQMKIRGSKGTISWDEERYDDSTLKIYRSDAITNAKYGYLDVSYQEIGEVPFENGEFTVNDLKDTENHYYGFVVYANGIPVYKTCSEFGKLIEDPRSDGCDYNKKAIEVPFYTTKESGQSLIIYRKNAKGKFVEIGKVKPGEFYVDKNVKPGRSYTYRARSFKTIKGKTYYSKYTDEVTVSAVNKTAKIKMSFDKKDRSIVKIKSSNKYNGVIRDWEDSITEMYDKKHYKIVQYSFDGKKWKNTDGSNIPALKPGKTIMFKLSDKPAKSDDLFIKCHYGENLREGKFFEISYDGDKGNGEMYAWREG